jgi:hypothetical protein
LCFSSIFELHDETCAKCAYFRLTIVQVYREGMLLMHSSFLWRRNPTKTLGFLLPWISPWFFVGFLLSPPPYAQSVSKKTKRSCFGGFFSLVF